ncbi:hypothetical protein HDU93_008820 [Gonapodya sp. JEL0774]|nr:hypothetical protein HDU93_008820 [Gonapodya sp. JEL0774]
MPASKTSTNDNPTSPSGQHPPRAGSGSSMMSTHQPGPPAAKKGKLRLLVAIVLQVFINLAAIGVALTAIAVFSAKASNDQAIAQGTASINTLAKTIQIETSKILKGQCERSHTYDPSHIPANYLQKLRTLAADTSTILTSQRGAYDPRDLDTVIPWMRKHLQASNITVLYQHYALNATNEDFGVGYFPYSVNGISRREKVVADVLDQKPDDVPSSMPHQRHGWQFDVSGPNYNVRTRPYFTLGSTLASDQPRFTDPGTSTAGTGVPPRVTHALAWPLYAYNGSFLGVLSTTYSLDLMSAFLDETKSLATENTLMYIMTGKGEVLGMSGLADQQQLIKTVSGSSLVKNIWDYDFATYPLLNLSSGEIYRSANANLSSLVDEREFSFTSPSDGRLYLFQFVTYYQDGFRWILVSGAPATDYLSNTLALQDELALKLSRTSTVLIVVAVVFVIGLTPISLLFTYLTITKPLGQMLDAMGKAAAFDFSIISNGELKNRSSVREVSDIQDMFLKMLKSFVNALRDNKKLMSSNAAPGGGATGAPRLMNSAVGAGMRSAGMGM